MDLGLDWLRLAGETAFALLKWPFIYMAIAIVWWHSRQSVVLQRQLFHVRLYGTLTMTLAKVLAGIGVGVVLSLLGMATGANLTLETLVCVWAATVLLALFKLRYVCLAYAAGVLGIIQVVLSWTSVDISSNDFYGEALRALSQIDVPGLLFLAGLLHIAEAVLIRLQGAKFATPLFLEGKRGKPVGAYSLSGVWPVPLLWLIPAASGHGLTLPWTPLFGMNGVTAAGWTLAAFPVLIGFSDRTETRWPEEKARDTSKGLLLYGIGIALLAVGAAFWSPLTMVAAVSALVLHEGLLLRGRYRERGRQPLYVQNTGRGVTVLAVLPRTPASEMGVLAGEVITKVNGMKVRNKEELHAALQIQSAFCKLEVLNREGNLKFAQRARYAGEHYQLGLILAPDEDAEYVAAPRSASLKQGLLLAGARMRSGHKQKAAERAAIARLHEAAEEQAAAAEVQAAALEAAKLLEPEPPAAEPVDPGLPPRSSRR